MRITKVKIKDRVDIEWIEAPENNPEEKIKNWDKYAISLGFPPLGSFSHAMQNLVQDIVSICELSDDDAQFIQARSVSFTYHHGVLGAIITGIKDLEDSNGIVLLNTPHKPSEAYSDNGSDVNLLDADTVARLETLLKEAKRYIKGERGERVVEQQNLPFDSPDPNDDSVKYVLPDFLTQLCEMALPELLATDKCAITMIEGRPYVVAGYTGNATDGFTEARVWKAVKAIDFEGETLTYQQLPPGGNLRGHEVSDGKAKWVIVGEEITLKPEPETDDSEHAQSVAPDDLEINDNPFEIPEGERVQ